MEQPAQREITSPPISEYTPLSNLTLAKSVQRLSRDRRISRNTKKFIPRNTMPSTNTQRPSPSMIQSISRKSIVTPPQQIVSIGCRVSPSPGSILSLILSLPLHSSSSFSLPRSDDLLRFVRSLSRTPSYSLSTSLFPSSFGQPRCRPERLLASARGSEQQPPAAVPC